MPLCEDQIRPGRLYGLQTSGAQGFAWVCPGFITAGLFEMADQVSEAVFRYKHCDFRMADDQYFL